MSLSYLIGCGWALFAIASVALELSPKIPTDAIVTKLSLAGVALFALYQAKNYLPI